MPRAHPHAVFRSENISIYTRGIHNEPIYYMDLDNLVKRAKEKDPEALATIYSTYYPKMVGICMNIIKEDRVVVDDLVHDAFILAFVSISSLRDNSKLSEWLTSIIKNVSLRHIEQRDRVHILPISSIKEEDTIFVDPVPSPDADLNYKELIAHINQLPEGYSQILRLSVIEGFSHKEIADMLGIKPHSSSSQLARAKNALKRILDNKTIVIIAIMLIPLALYLIFNRLDKPQDEIVFVDEKHGGQLKPSNELSKSEQQEVLTGKDNNSGNRPVIDIPTPRKEKMVLTDKDEMQIMVSDSDTATVMPHSVIHNDVLVTETVEDSTISADKDSILKPIILPDVNNITESLARKKKNWQFLAAGSLGPALAQSAYKLIATSSTNQSGIGSSGPDPDGHTYVVPKFVSTWEEYSKYLRAISSSNPSADTLELIEIAERNTGRIKQREHHDQPITFGISMTKSIGRNWSLETGLQYSLLRSRFSMGENGDSVADKQRIHYLGLPLRVSYKWIDYKRLSAYTSLGVTMHIPVYAKVSGYYYNAWHNVFSQSGHFRPPLQWQTGVSLGVQYQFSPQTSFFVEPTFNWFIPAGGDTHTIWTEHPFMFTCPFGLRITW